MEAVIPPKNEAAIDVEAQSVVRRRRSTGWRRHGHLFIAVSVVFVIAVAGTTTSAGKETISALFAATPNVPAAVAAAAISVRSSFFGHAEAIREMNVPTKLRGYMSTLSEGMMSHWDANSIYAYLPKIQTIHLVVMPRIPQISTTNFLHGHFNMMKETTKSSSHAILTFSAESAELAWETSESLLQHLSSALTESQLIVEESKDENAFVKAIEGITIHLRGKRRDEHNQIEEEPRKRERASNRRDSLKKAAKNAGQRERGKRRLSVQDENLVNSSSVDSANGGRGVSLLRGLVSKISSSPIASLLLAFSCVAVLAAIFVSNQIMESMRRRRRESPLEGRSIILDEDEAEIVEFYEKEMESGALFAYRDIHGDEEDDPSDHDCMLNIDSEQELRYDEKACFSTPEGACDVRPNPKQFGFTRHDSRDSHCDSYYSRVLQDIETLTYNEDHIGLVNEGSYHDECQNGVLNDHSHMEFSCNNFASEDVVSGLHQSSHQTTLPPAQTSVEDTVEHDKGHFQEDVTGYESRSSSVSSLTNEEHMESEMGSTPLHCAININKNQQDDTQPLYGVSNNYSPPTWIYGQEDRVSTSQLTPTRSNVCRERKPSNHIIGAQRRVSFSPEVKIHFTPLEVKSVVLPMSSIEVRKRKNNEKSLYLMLLAVGIAIAMASFFPSNGFELLSSVIKKGCEGFYNPDETSPPWSLEL